MRQQGHHLQGFVVTGSLSWHRVWCRGHMTSDVVLSRAGMIPLWCKICALETLTMLQGSCAVYEAAHLPNLHKGRPQLRQDLPQALSLRACTRPHRLAAAPYAISIVNRIPQTRLDTVFSGENLPTVIQGLDNIPEAR